MDNIFDKVISKLEELDLTDNTLVIFYSDNGEMFWANMPSENPEFNLGYKDDWQKMRQ